MKLRLILIILFGILIIFGITDVTKGQSYIYQGSWGPEGMSLISQERTGVELNFSVKEFTMMEIEVEEEVMKQVLLPGHLMQHEPGAPNLPGRSYLVAMPNGAIPHLNILSFQSDTLDGIDIVPAPVIPIDNSNEPLVYLKDPQIYQADAFYPSSPAVMAETMKIRGVDVGVMGFTPFQYNPVTKQLVVFYNCKIAVGFEGGDGIFGEGKYRSRYWDPIIKDFIVNHESLPEVSYARQSNPGSRNFAGCEYLIITPDGSEFQQWADSIKAFRTEQGILTHVVTITEVGGNTAAAIEAYINNAYNNWDIPPDACLMLGDYGADPQNRLIADLLYDHPAGSDYNPYITDNLFADVDGDLLPEIAFARITARNAAELSLMVSKFLDYERNPPVSANFYDNPITALGWQTTRWFQICSESIGGYFKNVQGKDPVRINEIYSGNPSSDPWSTATNTATVVDYFGPSGQGYIPSSPSTLGGWTGGTATDVNNAINSGSFILQHRDHGNTQLWGEPYYTTSDINALTNSELTFVLSINCRTGKFDAGSDCLAEKFHRHSYNGQGSGALGVIAPTEVSYSFVNDTYTWGFYDHLWPDFMPDQETNPVSRGLLPCFGNAAGKYHLFQSTWPSSYNSVKPITYKLFHYHGDAFSTLYSEVPQALTVVHDNVISADTNVFYVTANDSAFIALTINGEIIGTTLGTGSPTPINFSNQLIPEQQLIVTVTKKNHFRYRSVVTVIPAEGPHVVLFGFPEINDSTENNNGNLDYGEMVWLSLTLKNVGDTTAFNIQAAISTVDSYVTLVDSVQYYGNIAPDTSKIIPDGFQFSVAGDVPDNHQIIFNLNITDGTDYWTGSFTIDSHAPVYELVKVNINDISGNRNGILDPGETAIFSLLLKNNGSAASHEVSGVLTTLEPLISILPSARNYGLINPGESVWGNFEVTADPLLTPFEWITFGFLASDDPGASLTDSIKVMAGQIPALVLDLDPDNSSGPVIQNEVAANGLTVDYFTVFPGNLEIYKSVLVCLGIYNINHVLTESQGQALAEYLDSGGNLYMEGGDTWAWDPATPVHPMFNIDGLSDGAGNLASITGVSGTYAEGLSFSYGGQNNFIDQLGAIAPAFATLTNSSPVYTTCVSYDAGAYKTIGSSHEFGGLNDTTYTKTELMRLYLGFFGIPASSEWLGVTADWHNPANWSNGLVPDENTYVIVPATNTQPSQFSGGNSICKGIKLDPGVQLIVPSGITLIILNE